jgi:amidohydrolase
VLQAHRADFAGEIRLLFQQGEEIGAGARQFIDAGALKCAGRVFGIHMASDIPVGKIGIKAGPNNAAVDYFRVTVHGKSAHVSTPQKGADALYAASQIVTALQGIVTRQNSPVDTIIIGVGTLNAGTAYNIVAESAALEGTTRTFTPELRENIKRRIGEVSTHTAAVSDCTINIEWKDFTSVLVNDRAVCTEVREAAAAIIGNENVITDRELSLGGDDFAEFLLQTPGVYAYVGSGNPALPNTVLPHHNCRFDIDENALVIAAGIYAEYAAWFLSSP